MSLNPHLFMSNIYLPLQHEGNKRNKDFVKKVIIKFEPPEY